MKRLPPLPTALAVLTVLAVLGACGPKFRPGSLEPEGGYPPSIVDERPLVQQITGLDVEPSPGGVIIRAQGLPPTQGWWDAGLVNVTDDKSPAGTLVYEFRVRPPLAPTPVGTTQSRRIDAGAYANTMELGGIRSIMVKGAQNSLSARP